MTALEAPTIPIEIQNGKHQESPLISVTAKPVEEQEASPALTEEAMYPDRAILTSEFCTGLCFTALYPPCQIHPVLCSRLKVGKTF